MTEPQNPYVGLRPFFLQDSLQFFGRESQTAELLSVLHEHRFLGVVGSSGSGKSSLVRAGLLPALFGGFLVGDRDRWQIVQIKPGDSPTRNLAAGLLAASSDTPPSDEDIATLETAIRDDQIEAVIAFVKARLTPRESLFLLVDQFEEIFGFRRAGVDQRAEAADFVALLMALAEESADVPVFVALTMRTDFLGDCDLFYGLPEIMNRGQYLVPRLTRQQLRLAIEGPAMLTGACVAPRLLDLLLNKLGDREDRLPVIQHALLRTWDVWNASGAAGPIEVDHFNEAGGLENALNLDAQAAFAEVKAALPNANDVAIASVFKALTETDQSHRAVRRPAHVSELMAAADVDRATVDAVIRCFSHKHRNFLHADGWPAAADPRVDISHESLIRQWGRLREWVDEERKKRDRFTALVVRARSWQTHGVPLQGNELKSADAWWKLAKPTAVWAQRYAVADDDFDVAQRHVRESTTARRRTTVLRYVSAAVLIAAVAGTLALMQRSRAKTAAATELLRDMEIHATSLLERDPESAIVAGLIAAEAHASLQPGTDLPIALEAIVLRAWQTSALIKTERLAFDGDADSAMVSPDGHVVVLGGPGAVDGDGGVKAFDLTTGRLIASKDSAALVDGCTAFSSDGRWFHFTNKDISARWSLSTGAAEEVPRKGENADRTFQRCAYSPDASVLAWVSSSRDSRDWVLTLAKMTGQGLTKIRDIPLAANAEAATALRFSRTGNDVAVAIWGKDTALSIFDVQSGAAIKRFKTANPVSALAFLPDGGFLVTAENAFTHGLFLRSITDDFAPVMFPNSASDDDYRGIEFSPDGRQLAAVNGETALLWDLTNGLLIGSFTGHQRAIIGVAFDAEGRLVTVGQDAEVRHWRTGAPEKHAFKALADLRSAVFSTAGTSMITAAEGGVLEAWNVEHPEQPFPAKFDVPNALRLALSPDAAMLAAVTGSLEQGDNVPPPKIKLLDVRSGSLLAELNGESAAASLAFSPDGRRLAIAENEHAKVWTMPSVGAQPLRLPEPLVIAAKLPGLLDFDGLAFSLDAAGRQLATVGGSTVWLWNSATGACEGRIDTQSPVVSLAYVPGGIQLATGDRLGRVRFWSLALALAAGCDDSAAKKNRVLPTSTLQEHHGAVNAITFVGDGSRFATASDDRTAKVWDTKTDKVLLTFRHVDAVTNAAFSADGRLLMTTVRANGAKVWEVPLRQEILPFARGRLTRKCLTKEERRLFFPDEPSTDTPCMPVPVVR